MSTNDNGFIYSEDPAEEARLLLIRDTPSDRLRLIGKTRSELGRMQPELTDVELNWIIEDRRWGGTIARMEPREYDVVIGVLAARCDNLNRQIERLQKPMESVNV